MPSLELNFWLDTKREPSVAIINGTKYVYMLVYYSSLKVEYLPHRETWQRQAPGRTTHAQNKKVQCCIVGPFCCTAFDANVSGYLDKNAF